MVRQERGSSLVYPLYEKNNPWTLILIILWISFFVAIFLFPGNCIGFFLLRLRSGVAREESPPNLAIPDLRLF